MAVTLRQGLLAALFALATMCSMSAGVWVRRYLAERRIVRPMADHDERDR